MKDSEILAYPNTITLEHLKREAMLVKMLSLSRTLLNDESYVDSPLIKQSSSSYCLIDISVWIRRGLSIEWLWKLLVLSVEEKKASSYKKSQKEKKLQEVAHNKETSEKVKYCLVSNNYLRILPILERVSSEMDKRPFIINIDGPAASGKSTIGRQLSEITNSSLIHMDDFFLPETIRTKDRLEEVGGNVHYERFKTEVVDHLKSNESFTYRKYNCRIMDYDQDVLVDATPIIIVEGSYSNHPIFGDYSDLKVYSQVSDQEQRVRIERRNGLEKLKVFVNTWIPMENKYFEAYKIEEKSDLVI